MPDEIMSSKDLTPATKLVYCILLDMARQAKKWTVRGVAEAAGLNKDTVRQAIKAIRSHRAKAPQLTLDLRTDCTDGKDEDVVRENRTATNDGVRENRTETTDAVRKTRTDLCGKSVPPLQSPYKEQRTTENNLPDATSGDAPKKELSSHTLFVRWWSEGFLKKTGNKYIWQGKDHTAVKRALAAMTLDDLKAVARSAVNDEGWWRFGANVAMFANNPNKYRAAANGQRIAAPKQGYEDNLPCYRPAAEVLAEQKLRG